MGGSGPRDDEPEPKSQRKAKRKAIVAACGACRQRKIKCSGERPQCSFCMKRDECCEYDPVAALETHGQSHKRKTAYKTPHSQNLLNVLRNGTDEQAVAVFRQICPRHDLVNASKEARADAVALPTLLAQNEPESAPNLVSSAVAILGALTSNTDEDTSMLLARLRTGESWENLTRGISLVEPPHLSVTKIEEASPPPSPSRSERESHTHQDAFIKGIPWLPPIFDREVWARHRRPGRSRIPASQQNLLPNHSFNSVLVFAPALSNYFGNLPFSEAVWANNYPEDIQQSQVRNIFAPVWAMRILNRPCGIADPFERVFTALEREINDGKDAEVLCGPHVFVGALEDEDTFKRAPKLSQVAASVVASVKFGETSPTTTQYAMMWCYWTLWRWMLLPSRETYKSIPALIRPTPYQLFALHAHVFDFVFSPALRDHMCQFAEPDGRWLTQSCITIFCDWPGTTQEALCRDGTTGELDLNDIFKSQIATADIWYLGPSVRPFLPNADLYARIK